MTTNTATKSWLAGITEQIESLVANPENFIEPAAPIPETPEDELGEVLLPKVLGEMTPTMKALYTLWQDEIHKSLQIIVDATNPRNHKEGDVIRIQVGVITSRIEIRKSMFWEEVKNQFPVAGTDLGVCKGFKVVQLPPRSGGHLLLHHVFEGLEGLRGVLDR